MSPLGMPAEPPADDVLELTDLVRLVHLEALRSRTAAARSRRAYAEVRQVRRDDRQAITAARIQASVDGHAAALWTVELNRLVDEAKRAGLDL